MIDHIGLSVADYEASKAFYRAALAPLGHALLMEITEAGPFAGFGEGGKPDFWLGRGRSDDAARARRVARPGTAGATDNGPPGIRAEYHPNYYGAFVLDPDGHNVEAVCHEPG